MPLPRACLTAHGWRGNVRELENTIHRAVLLARGDVIDAGVIELLGEAAAPVAVAPASDGIGALVGRRMNDVERDLILRTLGHTGGNRTHAATILGISIRALRNKLARLRAGRRRSAAATDADRRAWLNRWPIRQPTTEPMARGGRLSHADSRAEAGTAGDRYRARHRHHRAVVRPDPAATDINPGLWPRAVHHGVGAGADGRDLPAPPARLYRLSDAAVAHSRCCGFR